MISIASGFSGKTTGVIGYSCFAAAVGDIYSDSTIISYLASKPGSPGKENLAFLIRLLSGSIT